MNILYLTATGNSVGGAEISLFNLLENLDKDKFKPHFLIPFEGDYTKKIRDLGFSVEILDFKLVKNLLNLIHSIRTIKKIIKILKDNRIDLIHSNTQAESISFLSAVAAKICKLPFIWHPRVMFTGVFADSIQYFLSTKVIVISEAAKSKFWYIFGKKKIEVVYNGIDLEGFKKAESQVSLKSGTSRRQNDFLIGSIGRVNYIKGYEYFIRSAKLVLEKIPNARFIIVGFDKKENKYQQSLEVLKHELNLEDKIIFMEKTNDIREVLASLDLFIFTSLGDAFGRVLIEAMALSKPIISFDSGATSEIIEAGKTGILVKTKDYKALADEIIKMLGSKDKRDGMGRAARERVEQLFSIKEHTENIESIYLNFL